MGLTFDGTPVYAVIPTYEFNYSLSGHLKDGNFAIGFLDVEELESAYKDLHKAGIPSNVNRHLTQIIIPEQFLNIIGKQEIEEIRNQPKRKLKIIGRNTDTEFGYNTAFNKIDGIDGWPIFKNARDEWVLTYMPGYYVEKIDNALREMGIPHKFIEHMEMVTIPDQFVEIVPIP